MLPARAAQALGKGKRNTAPHTQQVSMCLIAKIIEWLFTTLSWKQDPDEAMITEWF